MEIQENNRADMMGIEQHGCKAQKSIISAAKN